MTEQARNLISRTTLGFVGMLLLYAGYACEVKAVELYGDEQQRIAGLPPPAVGRYSNRRMDAAFLVVGAIGGVLLLGGGLCSLASVVPWSWWEKLLRRKAPVTHESPEETWHYHM